MQETQIQSLGQEGTLEEETAMHSSIPAWKIPWTEEPGGLQSVGLQKSQTWLSEHKTWGVSQVKPETSLCPEGKETKERGRSLQAGRWQSQGVSQTRLVLASARGVDLQN